MADKIERPTILVVDDNEGIRSALSELLRADFRVMLSEDAESGLRILAKNTVALVLLDISLPGMAGTDLLTQIKSTWPALPVIMITADNQIETALKCFERGAFDHVVKPLCGKALERQIKRALGIIELEKAVSSLSSKLLEKQPEDIQEMTGVFRSLEQGRIDLQEAMNSTERALIIRVLGKTGYHMTRAAEHLGIGRDTLYRKANALGIPLAREIGSKEN